jgi:hypothetical protein
MQINTHIVDIMWTLTYACLDASYEILNLIGFLGGGGSHILCCGSRCWSHLCGKAVVQLWLIVSREMVCVIDSFARGKEGTGATVFKCATAYGVKEVRKYCSPSHNLSGCMKPHLGADTFAL